MRKTFKDLLHQYKVEAFKISHSNEAVTERTNELLKVTEEALNNAYTYHFHKDPDRDRLETLTLVKNFTLESILPPVLEKLVRRIVVLEKQHEELVKLVDGILETLSDEPAAVQKKG